MSFIHTSPFLILFSKKYKYTPAVRCKIRRNSYLLAVCDTPIARITGCVIIKDMGRLLPLELHNSVACTRVSRVMLINLCAEPIKLVFEGDKI